MGKERLQRQIVDLDPIEAAIKALILREEETFVAGSLVRSSCGAFGSGCGTSGAGFAVLRAGCDAFSSGRG